MPRAPWLASLLIALFLLPPIFVGAHRAMVTVNRWRGLIRQVASEPLEERLRATLERPVAGVPGGTPGLIKAASLLQPAMEGSEPLSVQFAFVAHGDLSSAELTARGGTLLIYHFAPHAWPVYVPLGMLEEWIERSEPGRAAPELVAGIHESEIFLFYDLDRAAFARLRERVIDRLGVDLLVPGRSAGDRHHVALLPSLVERIERGVPAAQRFRALLP